MPGPWSFIVNTKFSPFLFTLMENEEPSGENLTALSIRLTQTCLSRERFPLMISSSISRSKEIFFLLYRKFRFLDKGEKALLIEHMLNQQGNGHDNRTMVRFRRYKNLLLQTNRQKGRLHSENNPYPEGHPRSYGECPRMSFLRGGFSMYFLRSSSISGFMVNNLL